MTGRKRAISKDIVHSVFDKYKEIIVKENGVIGAKEGKKIWETLQNSKEINKKMTVGALYTEAYKWFHEMKKSINDSNDDQVDELNDDFNDISLEISSNGSNENSSSEDDTTDIKFSVTLSYEVWDTIKPVEKTCFRNDRSHKIQSRTYYVLQPGVWTNVLIERIAKHRQNIICTLSFKRSKVFTNGNHYLHLTGMCTTCGALLSGFVTSQPKKEEDVKFYFKLKGFDDQKHIAGNKSVRIGGSRAKELFTSNKTASVLRRENILESGAKMFEKPKGREVSLNAIRCGQYRHNQSKKLSESTVQAVEYLKESNYFGPMIQMIGLSPFFTMYGSRNQFALYDAYKSHKNYTKVSCDATGGLVHKLRKSFVIDDKVI